MSSYLQNSPFVTATADADLSAKQFYIVINTSTGNTPHCNIASSAQASPILGVLQNAPVSGDEASVVLRNANGAYLVIAGATISAGDKLTSNGSGQAITTTTTGDQIIGTALVPAVSGDIFMFTPGSSDRV